MEACKAVSKPSGPVVPVSETLLDSGKGPLELKGTHPTHTHPPIPTHCGGKMSTK